MNTLTIQGIEIKITDACLLAIAGSDEDFVTDFCDMLVAAGMPLAQALEFMLALAAHGREKMN